MKYDYQTKEYKLYRDQYETIDDIVKPESASKVAFIRNFPPIKKAESESFLSQLFFMKPKSQVNGSEAFNALTAIKNDLSVSQIYGFYTLESEKFMSDKD